MAGFSFYIKVADIAVFGGRLHLSIYFQWSKVVSEATNLCSCIQKVTNFLGPEDQILQFTYSESSHQIRQIG